VLFELVAHELARRFLPAGILFVARIWGVVGVFHRGVDIVGAGNFRVRAIFKGPQRRAVDNGESVYDSEFKTLGIPSACVEKW
jgi:hypothetical protein